MLPHGRCDRICDHLGTNGSSFADNRRPTAAGRPLRMGANAMILEQGLRRSARLWPEKIAAIDGERSVTYAEFAERVNRLANALIGLRFGGGGGGGGPLLNPLP